MTLEIHPSLVELRSKVDDFMMRVQSQYPRDMACQAGCSSCCQGGLSAFPVEAGPMMTAVESLPRELREVVREQSQNEAHCPFLVNENCVIYDQRPVICRTQGLPLLLEDGSVDSCPLNFVRAGQRDSLPHEDVLNLKSLNFLLSMLHSVHIRQSGQADRRISFLEIAG